MNTSGLSLEQAPPFSAPLRFFLTAPVFGMLFSLGIIFLQPDFLNYKSVEVIGLFHLLTIGYFGFIMLGALQQMLPVIAGVVIEKPLILSTLSHALLSFSLSLFSYGMIFQKFVLIKVGSYGLFLGFLVLLIPFLIRLLKRDFNNSTTNAMRLAVIGAIATVLLGTHLGVSYGSLNFSSLHLNLGELHVAMATMGWILTLVIGVSFQVVPMFYVTPAYPKFCFKWPLIIFSGLSLFFLYQIFLNDTQWLRYVSYTVFALAGSAFAAVTFRRFSKRKRPVTDTTIRYWQLALTSLFAASLIMADLIFSNWENQIYSLSVLFFIGFGVSLLNGMLYKIIPFLAWFHISSTGRFDVPTMRDFLPDKRAKVQYFMHFVAFLLFILGIFSEDLIILGGVFFFLSNLLIEINLFRAYKLYKLTLKKPAQEGFSWN